MVKFLWTLIDYSTLTIVSVLSVQSSKYSRVLATTIFEENQFRFRHKPRNSTRRIAQNSYVSHVVWLNSAAFILKAFKCFSVNFVVSTSIINYSKCCVRRFPFYFNNVFVVRWAFQTFVIHRIMHPLRLHNLLQMATSPATDRVNIF